MFWLRTSMCMAAVNVSRPLLSSLWPISPRTFSRSSGDTSRCVEPLSITPPDKDSSTSPV